MKAKFWTGVVITLLLIFLAGAVASAWRFLRVDDLAARSIGVSVLLLVGIGAWVLIREVSFGWGTERLGRALDAEGGLPADTVDRSPGGRADREQADAQFERYRAETQQRPEDWRSWFRLAVAYDVASDRSRARRTMRRAIAMERAARRG